ncbi:uncharacterized protein SCODWIG_03617 [Saccharomycodes ludwigii]|uniref:PQ-loop repeat-containing protein 1 n=1 Tax=Saccharomycodes ludwigii TaxID=36035 RepID=A0A376BB51_9ASCO|nr:hypothetical protein SCDLUD_002485 [Saccharomycodes ludwigii]KAH3901018.1 hypothetical protein SCDLUD_002485 [Saccharomycodes ludwigii]SSD61856.1 uncharacterized protein SCODWIG_03617 [Saccharomycodes ludwigii]
MSDILLNDNEGTDLIMDSIVTATAELSKPIPTPGEHIDESPLTSILGGYEQYLPKVDQFYIPEWFSMQFIINNMISFTPLISYGTTVLSIRKCKTALGFSIDICATMLIASILRISYYLITPYETTLLRQALVMVFIQIILLHTSLQFRPDEYVYENLQDVEPITELLHDVWLEYFPANPFNFHEYKALLRSLSWKNLLKFGYKLFLVLLYKFLKFFDPSYKRVYQFWQWSDTFKFWKFLVIFTTLQVLFTFFISKIMDWESLAQWIGSFIGSLGLFIESTLPLPQIAILNKLKSIQGFKLILLVSWLCGDILKLSYLIFGANNISIIFVVFGTFQMFLDIYIGGQYIYYKYYYISPKDVNKSGQNDDSLDIEMSEFDITDNNSSQENLGNSST